LGYSGFQEHWLGGGSVRIGRYLLKVRSHCEPGLSRVALVAPLSSFYLENPPVLLSSQVHDEIDQR
jgi:hypothetical protein